jgi:hypothetical protein
MPRHLPRYVNPSKRCALKWGFRQHCLGSKFDFGEKKLKKCGLPRALKSAKNVTRGLYQAHDMANPLLMIRAKICDLRWVRNFEYERTSIFIKFKTTQVLSSFFLRILKNSLNSIDCVAQVASLQDSTTLKYCMDWASSAVGNAIYLLSYDPKVQGSNLTSVFSWRCMPTLQSVLNEAKYCTDAMHTYIWETSINIRIILVIFKDSIKLCV